MEMRISAALALLLLTALTASAGAGQLSGAQMRTILSGNSIIHPNFGCLFFLPDGSTRQVNQSGDLTTGRWTVRDDTYYSTGQCGTTGCSISGEYPSLTFRRSDGGYEQPVTVIRGNYCEKDGIVS